MIQNMATNCPAKKPHRKQVLWFGHMDTYRCQDECYLTIPNK